MLMRITMAVILSTMIILSSLVAQAAQTLPFTDKVIRPFHIEADTVIITTNHGMWVSIDPVNYVYYCEQRTESVCIYQDGLTTIMSFLSSGAAVSVIEMPDPAPIVATTKRPENMYPGTVLFLSNGQVVNIFRNDNPKMTPCDNAILTPLN